MAKDHEEQWDVRLPQHTFAALRLDGKGFSKFTRPLRKETPFNQEFNQRMLAATEALLEHVDGVFAALVGSDEISLLVQDLGPRSEKWHGGRVQKMASISASIAGVAFNRGTQDMAFFDSRVFDLGPEPHAMRAYLEERRRSLLVNSVSMQASFHFPHRFLLGMGVEERKHHLRAKGVPWEEVGLHDRFGTFFFKVQEEREVTFTRQGQEETITALRNRWERTHVLQGDFFNRDFLY